MPLPDSDAALIPGLWDLRAGDGNREVAVHVLADYGGRRYVWDGYVDRVEGVLDEQTRTLDVNRAGSGALRQRRAGSWRQRRQ